MLVAGLSLEANTFVPGETTLEDFRRQSFAVGGEVTRELLGPSAELTGALDVLAAAGAEVVPTVVAAGSPGAPLAAGVTAEVVRLALAACDGPVDGAYVMLHGAAAARDEDDPEGVLLAALRERLGPEATIAISLDCHAHLTERMAAAVDAITAYRTCPHLDLYERGAQAARILVRALAGEVRPVVAVARRPMVTPPELHDHTRDPFRRLMALCDGAEADGALAAGILAVQPWMDVPELGWKAVVTTDGEPETARRAAERLADEMWSERQTFCAVRPPPTGEALSVALAGPAPYVFADSGDATNGGSVGDSTELLRAALRGARGRRVLLSVRDPEAARAAFAAGAGAEVGLELGTGGEGAYNERVRFRGRIAAVRDEPIRYTHPAAAGRDHPGRAALVEADGLAVVVHESPVRVIDPVLYEALGADPAAWEVVQAKSHVSYRAGFERVTPRSVVAGTPGPTTADLASLPFRRRPRPLYPFEDADG